MLFFFEKKIHTNERQEGTTLGLSPASFLWARGEVDGVSVQRPYTPITPATQSGHFDLLVKRFPFVRYFIDYVNKTVVRYENGVMSRHLVDLKPGNTIDIKGSVN